MPAKTRKTYLPSASLPIVKVIIAKVKPALKVIYKVVFRIIEGPYIPIHVIILMIIPATTVVVEQLSGSEEDVLLMTLASSPSITVSGGSAPTPQLFAQRKNFIHRRLPFHLGFCSLSSNHCSAGSHNAATNLSTVPSFLRHKQSCITVFWQSWDQIGCSN